MINCFYIYIVFRSEYTLCTRSCTITKKKQVSFSRAILYEELTHSVFPTLVNGISKNEIRQRNRSRKASVWKEVRQAGKLVPVTKYHYRLGNSAFRVAALASVLATLCMCRWYRRISAAIQPGLNNGATVRPNYTLNEITRTLKIQ